MLKNCLLLCFFLLTISAGFAQDSIPFVLQPDVRELLNAKVELQEEEMISTGSFKEAFLREAAGIMSVISAKNIQQTAARDLRELLSLVAGFDFCTEASDNVVTLMVRGNSASSAGLLLMVNDIMLNDIAYGTYIFGNRIPLENIEKIEIIRGTGSLQYGGTASLAVINIITKKHEQGIGSTCVVQNGVSEGKFSRHNLFFSASQRFNNKIDVSLTAFRGYLRQSNGTDSLLIYDSMQFINYADTNMATSTNISLSLRYKDFKMSLMYDDFESKNVFVAGGMYHKGIYATISNTFQFGKKFSFTPLYSFRTQEPWNYYSHPNYVYAYNLNIRRHTLSGIFRYMPHEKFSLNFGVNFFEDVLRAQYPLQIFANGNDNLSVSNYGILAEMTYNTTFGNFIAGARLDKYSSSQKSVLVPRFAYTKIFGNFHAKALYSFSFRNPLAAEIGIATQGIEPQKSQSLEAEIGYQWKNRVNLTANIFNIINYDVIVYTFNDNLSDYTNNGSSGSNGAEIELKYQYKKLFFRSNYSFYTTNYSKSGLAALFFSIDTLSQTPDNLIPDNDRQYLGVASHKFTAQAAYSWTENLNTQATFILRGARATPNAYETIQEKSSLLLNLNFTYKNLIIKGLSMDFGAYNLLNQKLLLPPYGYGDEAFYTLDMRREWVLKLTYSL
jgi:outer membrane receptor protein involved in Fe transport